MPFDPQMTGRIHKLLEEWGWETAMQRLDAEINTTDDETRRSDLRFYRAWLSGARGAHANALDDLHTLEKAGQLPGWVQIGQAFVLLRQGEFSQAHAQLHRAEQTCDPADHFLQANLKHCRGTIYYHEGRQALAETELRAALALFGPEHFCTGRVLDTFGMLARQRDSFHAARDFFERSLHYKQRFQDQPGLALTHGQLGRLYADWGRLNKAVTHFTADLEISRTLGDERSVAQMYDELARVALEQRDWGKAHAFLSKALEICAEHAADRWLAHGFAHKDMALACLGQGRLDEAGQNLDAAAKLFAAINYGQGFPEGQAHVQRARGMVLRQQRQYVEARRAFRDANSIFESGEPVEAARTQLEEARTSRAAADPAPLVVDAYLRALKLAEKCRRDRLVQEIERELEQIDAAAYYQHLYQRTRGRLAAQSSHSLLEGKREMVSVMFLDVQGSTEYGSKTDPETVIMTINEMMAEFTDVLDKYEVMVVGYQGDGFMAVVREADHARRAAAAAVALLDALEQFNAPRALLNQMAGAKLLLFKIRLGIATGEVFIGNMGTYQRMDFAAIGNTSNLAARLQSEAPTNGVSVNRDNYERVRQAYAFVPDAPRCKDLKGLGETEIWDVLLSGITE